MPLDRSRSIKWIALRSGPYYECITLPPAIVRKANKAFRNKEDFHETFMDGSSSMEIKLRFHHKGGHILRQHSSKGRDMDKITTILGVYC